MLLHSRFAFALVTLALLAGCGSSGSSLPATESDSGPPNTAPDSGLPSASDAGSDSASTAPDGGSSSTDAGLDSGPVTTPDSGGGDANPACTSDVPCIPDGGTQACIVGVTTCGATGAVCTAMDLPSGTACGVNLICDGHGSCISGCVNGGACALSGATALCNVGAVQCVDGGASQCIATPVASGTTCGGGNVCDGNGHCVGTCDAGASCTLTGVNAPCNTGSISCSGSVISCVATPNTAANGASCGTNLICQDGLCTSCVAGVACVPPGVTNPDCYVGATTCGAAGTTCTATPAAHGTACGTNLICDGSGNCVSGCVSGGACTLSGQAALCNTGSVTCASDGGASQCVATPKASGTGCGASSACDGNGNCVATCTAGQPCTLTGVNAQCNTGATACTGNVLSCVPTPNAAENGQSCGSNMVCNGGQCAACTAGTNCTPAGACVESVTSCTTGTSQCVATTTKVADGTACTSSGTPGVCANGVCNTSCAAGGSCPPANTCHTGVFSCASGAQQCVDTGNALGNGAVCSLGDAGAGVCNAGACNACAQNLPCTPANECHVGETSCATGSQTCTDTNVNAVDGKACGTGGHCASGVCQLPGTLTATQGNAQTAYLDQTEPTPIVVVLKDSGGNPIVGASVTVASPAGADALPASGTTNGSGQFTFSAVLGRAPQQYTWTVSATNAPNLQVTGTATNPPAGTTFTLANLTHTEGDTPNPAPASQANIGSPNGFQILADGTVFFADQNYCVVRELSPQGVLSVVAGMPGQCGSGGDNGLATSAQLSSPWAVAVDVVNEQLYIADAGNNRIRQVDLSSGVISTAAGGGTAAAPGYGDGSVGTSAQLATRSIALGPNHQLAFVDILSGRIRYLDTLTGVVNAFLSAPVWPPSQCGIGTVPIAFETVGGSGLSQIIFDGAGNAWISAYFSGSEVNAPFAPCAGSNNVPAVVRMAPGGALTAFVGGSGSAASSADGTWSANYALAEPPFIALDPAGNIYMSEPAQNKIAWMDAGNGRVLTLSGTGGAGYAGDYVQYSSGIEFSNPGPIAFDSGGNLFVADVSNFALRALWGAARTVKLVSSMSIVSGNGATTVADQPGAQIRAKLVDSAGNPLVGYTIQFAIADAGGGLFATSAVTDVTGSARVLNNAGLAVGTYHFTASFNDPYGVPVTNSPLTYTLNATAPTTGDIFAVVNIDHSQGNTTVPTTEPPYGPSNGPMAEIGYPQGLAVGSNGTIYFSDQAYAVVRALGPRGDLTNVAGTSGSGGFSGDNGQALSAQLSQPWGLAIDNANGILYIADAGNNRIRALTLATGIITTVAGGGIAAGPGYGDGSVGTSAQLATRSIALGPNNQLVFVDVLSGRIRFLDTQTGIVNAWLSAPVWSPAQCGVGVVSLAFETVGGSGLSDVAFDSAGNAWISAYFSGSALNAPFAPCAGSNNVPAVVKWTAGGSLSAVVGTASSWTCGTATCNGSTALGSSALSGYYFNQPPFIGVDATGTLYMSESARNYVSFLSGSTVQLYAGNGSPAYQGDYVSVGSAAVELSNPTFITFTPTTNRFVVSDTNNFAVRMVWQ